MAERQDEETTPAVPGVHPRMKQRVDPDYRTQQDGSVPLDTVSVRQNEERGVWPVIWAVVTIVAIAISVYLLFG